MFSIRSVRFRLLAAVNVAIVLLLVVFVILDYRREIAERVLGGTRPVWQDPRAGGGSAATTDCLTTVVFRDSQKAVNGTSESVVS